MTSTRISRRTVLRGLGATLALPLLEAMLPATAVGGVAAGLAPRRMAFIMFPLGAWIGIEKTRVIKEGECPPLPPREILP